jgi:hypothetical protein
LYLGAWSVGAFGASVFLFCLFVLCFYDPPWYALYLGVWILIKFAVIKKTKLKTNVIFIKPFQYLFTKHLLFIYSIFHTRYEIENSMTLQ